MSNIDNNANEERTVDIREVFENVKEHVKNVFFAVVDFVIEHPGETAAIAGVATVGIRKVDKLLDIRRADRLRNSTIYDRSLGMYWETKKPLTSDQRLEIEARHKVGEPYGSILASMKLLKR